MSSSVLRRKVNQLGLTSGVCDTCGGFGPWQYEPIITDELARVWKLNKNQQESMSKRESMKCVYCGCSYRLRLLARAINYWVYRNLEKSLQENMTAYTKVTKTIVVGEINSCGVLHETLKGFDNLHYSEYTPLKSSGISYEDIQNLTYESNLFDVVLTSDVLEHVPDTVKSLREVYRVLKPGGAFILTIPSVHGRQSKVKASVKDGKIVQLDTASFHGAGQEDYLVWHEFGDDFLSITESVGFKSYELFSSTSSDTDMTGIYLAVKPQKIMHRIGNVDLPKLKLNKSRQVERVMTLSKKVSLTQDHANNLSKIVEAYKLEYRQALDVASLYKQEYKKAVSKHGRGKDNAISLLKKLRILK